MVPGRFGLQVPVEVLLRSLGRVAISNFQSIFFGIDLFRWSEDNLQNIWVGSRHPLEAKLIAQTRLGGPSTEIEYAKKLLLNTKAGDNLLETSELQFAADLVRNLGPNGPEGKLYQKHYLELADTIQTIRDSNGVVSPRLSLQEASLLREAMVSKFVPEDDLEARLALLKRAENILNDALRDIGDGKRQARLKSMLQLELASTLGTRAREFLRAQFETSLILDEFHKSRTAAMRARALQPEDFFPIDVIAWSTKDLLTHGHLDSSTRMEVIADLFNTFALCEGDEIGPRDREKLERRRAEFGYLLGNDDLKDDALEKLVKAGSTAGYYLTAIHVAKELAPSVDNVSEAQIENCARAAKYLRENLDAIKGDGKCLYLLLRYWWTANSRLPFYPSERSTIPFTKAQWKEALELLEMLVAADEQFSNPSVYYLRAICNWHLEYFDNATTIWRELEQLSDRVTGRRRVMKTYLASSSTGQPMVFHGTVDWISDDGSKGFIFVEGLRQKIAFFPRDFNLDDIRKDESLSEFHIAFNYIAPTADPVHHYKLSNRE